MNWDQIGFCILITGYSLLSILNTINRRQIYSKEKRFFSKYVFHSQDASRKQVSNNEILQKIRKPNENRNKWSKYIKVIVNYCVTFNSSLLVVGSLAESYLYGVRIVGNILSVILGYFYSFFIVQPFMYSLDEDIKTPYQYFERRYRNRKYVRAITAAAGMLFYFLFLTLYLWGCAVLLSTLIPQIPLWVSSIVIGAYSIIGSTIGGFTQSTKTNVLQFLILITGLLMPLGFTITRNKYFAPDKMWKLAQENNRTNFFDTSVDFTTRYTILNQLISLSIPWTCIHSLFLPNYTRYRNITGKKRSRFLIISNLPIMFVVNFILFISGGIFCYVYFFGCDPIYAKKIENKNQLGPHWIFLVLSEYVPSFSGILFASIIAYSIIQHSMGMALLCNTIFGEIIDPLIFSKIVFIRNKKKLTTWIKFILTTLLGFLSILLSVGFIHVRNTILSLFFVFNNSINSPIIGLFFLSAFNPYANSFGSMLAFIINLGVNFWLSLGAVLFSRLKSQEFPSNTFLCYNQSTNSSLTTDLSNYQLNIESNLKNDEEYYPKNPTLAYLYSIASIWYCLFSFLFMIIFGSLFSLIYSIIKTRSLDADREFATERRPYLYIYRMYKMKNIR